MPIAVSAPGVSKPYANRTQTNVFVYLPKRNLLMLRALSFGIVTVYYLIDKLKIMKNNISTKKMVSKFVGVYASVLVFIVLCSHIAIQNVPQDNPQNTFCFMKKKDAKATGQVNEMLFSIKSFILFE